MKFTIITSIFLGSISSLFAQTQISPLELNKALEKNNKIQLLDVRTAKEFEGKHIANAKNMDWKDQDNFVANVSKLKKNEPVYIYCLGGGRSAEAAKKLADLGYQVYDMQGGVMRWEVENLPLVKKDENIAQITKADFDAIMKKHEVVLVDFYADWCGPCKQMMPIINKIADKYKDKVKVIKIDVDKNGDLAKALNLTSIPAFFIYKKGIVSWKHRGTTTQADIERQLN